MKNTILRLFKKNIKIVKKSKKELTNSLKKEYKNGRNKKKE
jgi:hypothetical protein